MKLSTLFRWLPLGLAWSAGALAQTQLPVVRVTDFPSTHGAMLTRVAISKGFCEKHGIKCEVRVVPNSVVGMQMMLGGEIEVEMAPPETLIQAVNKGAKLKIIATANRDLQFYLMTSSRLGTPNAAAGYPDVMKDLKGKKVGVPVRGGGAESVLVSLLKGAGMDISDVTVQAVGATDTAVAAMSNGVVDAMLHYDPMNAVCEVRKICRIAVDTRRNQGPAEVTALNGSGAVLSVTAEFAEKKPQVLKAFRAAIGDASRWLQDPANAGEATRIAQSYFRLALPQGDEIHQRQIADLINRGNFRAEIDHKALQASADYLLRTGQIKTPINMQELTLP